MCVLLCAVVVALLADKVIDKILVSPLFGNVSISGSRNVLVNISVSSSEGLTLNEAHRVRDRVQYHAKTEDENGNTRLTNIIWGVSIKPNLAEDEMEVVVVATGFSNNEPITIKNQPEPEPEPEPKMVTSVTPTDVEKPAEKPAEDPARPKYRSAPTPITRPSRNFAEIEERKRTPAYIAHGVTLTTATKARPIGGVEKEDTTNSADMPALF